MSNNRSFRLLAIAAVLSVAAFGLRMVTTAFADDPDPVQVSTNPIKQPAGEVRLAAAEASDYFERHPEVLRDDWMLDLSDYYLRHPSAAAATVSEGATDWIQRHPEALRAAARTTDLSDYAARHADALKPENAPFMSDYLKRHP